jgi:hypothetical protein
MIRSEPGTLPLPSTRKADLFVSQFCLARGQNIPELCHEAYGQSSRYAPHAITVIPRVRGLFLRVHIHTRSPAKEWAKILFACWVMSLGVFALENSAQGGRFRVQLTLEE